MATSHINDWSSANGSSTTVSVSPATVGNLMWCGFRDSSNSSPTPSGGGVTTWTQIADGYVGTPQTTCFWGVVTTAGASTLTLSAGTNDIAVIEIANGTSPTWAVNSHGSNAASAGSLKIVYPTLTSPTPGANAVYLGFGRASGNGTAVADGSATGDAATYLITPNTNCFCYIVNTTNATAESPVQVQTGGDPSIVVAMIMVGTPSAGAANSGFLMFTQ